MTTKAKELTNYLVEAEQALEQGLKSGNYVHPSDASQFNNRARLDYFRMCNTIKEYRELLEEELKNEEDTTKASMIVKHHLNDAAADYNNGHPLIGDSRLRFVSFLITHCKGNLNIELTDLEIEKLWEQCCSKQ